MLFSSEPQEAADYVQDHPDEIRSQVHKVISKITTMESVTLAGAREYLKKFRAGAGKMVFDNRTAEEKEGRSAKRARVVLQPSGATEDSGWLFITLIIYT